MKADFASLLLIGHKRVIVIWLRKWRFEVVVDREW